LAQVTFEFRFEADSSEPSPNQLIDISNVKLLFKQWIAKKYFQESVNGGLQNIKNLNIQLLSYNDDSADFEVVDGWAEPVLRYSIIKK